MKWTETVLVARRRSDGAFYVYTAEGPEWTSRPAFAAKVRTDCIDEPPKHPGYYFAPYHDQHPAKFKDVEMVKLTITYDVGES